SKSIITRDFGCAIRRGGRFGDGPRRDRPSPSGGVELNDLGVTSRGHSECEFRCCSLGGGESHHASVIRTDRISPGEGLSNQRSGRTCAVSVQFTARQIPRAVRRESPHGRKNGWGGGTRGEPGEIKGVVTLQLGVVHPKALGSGRRRRVNSGAPSAPKKRSQTHD